MIHILYGVAIHPLLSKLDSQPAKHLWNHKTYHSHYGTAWSRLAVPIGRFGQVCCL